jgi:radical SAM protein with 4Fe4S-binding SPASM domain
MFMSFLAGNRANASPFALLVDVTRRCNLCCLHCRQHSPLASDPPPIDTQLGERDFPLSRFRHLCREAKEWSIRKIVLIGEGEPLLHAGLIDMIEAAKSAGCMVVLLTNGTLVDMSMAKEFVRSGLDELRFSLWASNIEEYRAQYFGTDPALFHRAVQGIRNAVNAKQASDGILPRIVLHRPIDPRFFRTLENTLNLASETKCDAISFSPLKPLLPQDRCRLLTDEQKRELIPILRGLAMKAQSRGLSHNTAEVLYRLRMGRSVWKHLPCYIGWTDMRLRVNGDVVPCDTCKWVLGNFPTKGLRQIWNSEGYREFRQWGRTRGGIARSGQDCMCDYCCHVTTNAKMYRFLRWCSLKTAS